MHFISVLVSGVTLLSLVEAHGGIPGAPKLFGRRTRASNNAKIRRNEFENATERGISGAVLGPHLDSRANTVGQCGSSFGSCAPGVCCSLAGYCGTGTQYCAAPDCQIAYGPGCDGNAVPPGGSTSNVPRPKLGSQPYGGAGIVDCIANGLVALTFDDGPYIYTSDLLDILKSYNAKATFFITGNNLGKGAIDDPSTIYPALIKRMYAEGHQIASHTWSHQDLSLITATERLDQMYNNEAALRNILGFFPTYMRPPYSSCDADCQSDLGTLGYHITYFDLDTDDYDNSTPDLIQNAKNNFDKAINGTNPASDDFLAIAHDIHNQTVYNLTKFMLDDLLAKGYKPATLGECLNDPATNWYRSSSPDNSMSSTRITSPSSSTTGSSTSSGISKPTATNISPDATCGGNTGYTCLKSSFGDCCSTHGYCGSTDAYCLPANGCQPLFGTCSAPSSSTSSTPSATPSLVISTDATCGGTTRNTCLGSTFGNCCSGAGYCGSTSAYCAAGCQALYGSCNTTPSPSGGVSIDASCGGTSNFTCPGSAFGNCCSHAGFCGSTDAYCLPANGCQTQFGTCSDTA